MAEDDSREKDPLLRELTDAQRACLEVIGAVTSEHHRGPVFQYLEIELDKQGLDANAVLRSLPIMLRGSVNYGLFRAERGYNPDERVDLTVAGLAHLAPLRDAADLYVRVLAGLADANATAQYNPLEMTKIRIDGPELVSALGLARHPFLDLLPNLLKNEPGSWFGSLSADGSPDWVYQPSGVIRRFRAVSDVPDYLARVRAWQVPAPPTPTPTIASPLGLAAALDYLSLAWKDRFDTPLLTLPDAERITRLAFEAHTEAEFDSRMSALREIVKDFHVGGLPGGAGRIPEFLKDKLSPGAEFRVKSAVETLQAVKHVRNGAQHADGVSLAATEMQRLGLNYPIFDYSQAWASVTAYVIDALRVLREELQALP